MLVEGALKKETASYLDTVWEMFSGHTHSDLFESSGESTAN